MTLSPKSVLPILSLSPIFKQKQKFPSSMTNFLLLSTLLEIKNHNANHRNPKKTTTFVFNKRSVTYLRKCPISQHLVSDSGHSIKVSFPEKS